MWRDRQMGTRRGSDRRDVLTRLRLSCPLASSACRLTGKGSTLRADAGARVCRLIPARFEEFGSKIGSKPSALARLLLRLQRGASQSESNWRRPRSYPQVSWASLFRLPCINPALSWSQIAHGQFAGREDRQEANRTGCRSRYRRYIMWPM